MRYLLFSLILLTGCHCYRPVLPETVPPPCWKEEFPFDQTFLENNRFWELFEDPLLNQLIEEAITANFDLQLARSRIIGAHALVLKERGNLLPNIDLVASAFEDETLIKPRDFGSPVKHLERVKQQQYRILGLFSYELDLWGRLRDAKNSACDRLKSSQWECEFIYQSLVSDVAIHYFTLLSLKEEICFLRRVIALWQDAIALHGCRVDCGLDSEIDLSRARLELALAQVEIEKVSCLYSLEENILSTLLGKPPTSLPLFERSLPELVPPLPMVLPSEVLMRRADIQAAAALVSAGRYDVDVAIKSYFPSFPLLGTLGLSSPLFSHFFEWQARYWSYTLSALQNLFDGGRRKGEVTAAKAQFAENFITYQNTVNQAFKEVEDALSILRYTHLQFDAQEVAWKAASDTLGLAQEQFKSGLISYLLVADAGVSAIAIERELISLKGEQIVAWIQLIQSLGLQVEEVLSPEALF